jgi:hypothetical protein
MQKLSSSRSEGLFKTVLHAGMLHILADKKGVSPAIISMLKRIFTLCRRA